MNLNTDAQITDTDAAGAQRVSSGGGFTGTRVCFDQSVAVFTDMQELQVSPSAHLSAASVSKVKFICRSFADMKFWKLIFNAI